jgi:hypothetical protein
MAKKHKKTAWFKVPAGKYKEGVIIGNRVNLQCR